MKGLILALVVFSMSAYGAKGFLKGSSISGMNKICSTEFLEVHIQ